MVQPRSQRGHLERRSSRRKPALLQGNYRANRQFSGFRGGAHRPRSVASSSVVLTHQCHPEHQICRILCWIRHRHSHARINAGVRMTPRSPYRRCLIFEAQTVTDQKHRALQQPLRVMSYAASN